MMANFPFFVFVGMLVLTYLQIIDAQGIGVCYGKNGNDLPSTIDVVSLYIANNITKMKTYDPINETLPALKGSEIEVILDIPNSQLQSLGDPQQADSWVTSNVVNYVQQVKIKYINVGNEVSPVNNGTSQFVPFLLPALTNLQQSIAKSGLQDQVKVTTAIETGLLATTYPPSESAFREDTIGFIKPIIELLKQNNAPLQANIYPYFGYIGDPAHVTLPYALFTQEQPDPSGYSNLFDAMLDSVYYAIDKAIGENNIEIVVSESGWPSEGGLGATVENAATFYTKLIEHAKSNNGTLHRPGKPIQTYLFAMFDENLKIGAETEKHFGVFHPNKTQKYNITF